jgi:hypothetical protein
MTMPGPPPPYGIHPVFSPPPPRRDIWSNGKLLAVVLAVLIPAIAAAIVFVPRVAHSVAQPRPRPFIGGLDDDPSVSPDLPDILQTLGVGQCVNPIKDANEAPESSVLPCSLPHQGEVFEVIPISGSAYPGEAALKGKLPQCQGRLSAYANLARVKGMRVFILVPSQARWDEGDEAVYCVVGSDTAETTGSVSRRF